MQSPNASKQYEKLFNSKPVTKPYNPLHFSDGIPTHHSSSWITILLSFLFGIGLTSGGVFLWRKYFEPLLEYIKREDEQQKKLNEEVNALKQMVDSLTTELKKLSDEKKVALKREDDQLRQSIKEDMSSVRRELQEIQSQLGMLTTNVNRNTFRQSSSNSDTEDIRIELAHIKGYLHGMGSNSKSSVNSFDATDFEQNVRRNVSQNTRRRKLPTFADPMENRIYNLSESEEENPYDIQDQKALSYVNEIKKNIRETKERVNVESHIIEPQQSLFVNNEEKKSFDELFNQAMENREKAVQEIINPEIESPKETEIPQNEIAEINEQIVETLETNSDPKLRKSKVFSFVKSMASGELSFEDGQLRRQVKEESKKKSEEVYDKLYNESKEEKSVQKSEDQEEIFREFETYDFENDEKYQKFFEFASSRNEKFKELTGRQLEFAILKIKATYFKNMNKDKNFDFVQYCKDRHIKSLNEQKEEEKKQQNKETKEEKIKDEAAKEEVIQLDEAKHEEKKDESINEIKPEEKDETQENQESQPVEEVTQAPYSNAYMDIIAKVQRGEEIQGIKKINDKPKNPKAKPTPSKMKPKLKAWERKKKLKEAQNKSKEINQEEQTEQKSENKLDQDAKLDQEKNDEHKQIVEQPNEKTEVTEVQS